MRTAKTLLLALLLALAAPAFADSDPISMLLTTNAPAGTNTAANSSATSPSTANTDPSTADSPPDSLGSFITNNPLVAKLSSRATSLVNTSMGFLGMPYRFGGNGEQDGGIDCSGFVRAVYEKTLGKMLPRRAVDQAAATRIIPKAELQPGDLVFFNTMQRAFSHVGIYIGNNQFIHAPRTGGAVRIESMNVDYWRNRFDGARRVDTTQNDSSEIK